MPRSLATLARMGPSAPGRRLPLTLLTLLAPACVVGAGACSDDPERAFCGDGKVSGNEVCDPLHDANCGFDCKLEPPVAELCDNTRDDDSDGQTDCADSDCFTSLSCLPSPCGNGQIDPGEECDRGAENAADAACSPTCTVDAAKSCAPRAPVDLTTVASHPTGDTWHHTFAPTQTRASLVGGVFPVACVAVARLFDGEALFTFAPPEAGSYEFSTAHAGTTVDTVVYTARDCGRGGLTACNDDDAVGGSRIVLADLPAGRPVFLAVAYAAGTAGDRVALSITKVPGVAAAGEACAANVCASGLRCVGGAAAARCAAPAAPVITSALPTRVRPDTLEVALEVTDPDLDLAGYGDNLAFLVPPIPSAEGHYALTLALTIPDSDWDGTPDVNGTIPLAVYDALGHTSAPVDLAFEPFPAATTAAVGAPCDLAGAAIVCESLYACTAAANGAVCADPVAPILTAITWRRTAWNQLAITMHGSDVNADVVAAEGQFGSYGGDNDNLWGSPLTPSPIGHTEFEGTFLLDDQGRFGSQIGWVGLVLRDATGRVSNNLYVDFDRPADPLATGSACDPLGVASVCGDSDTCAADGFGDWRCEPALDPVIEVLEGTLAPDGSGAIHVHLRASDPNADVTSLTLEWGDGTWASFAVQTFLTGAFHPSLYGRRAFDIDVTLVGSDLDQAIRGQLKDATGRVSRFAFDTLRPELASGAACGSEVDGLCSNDAALACGLGDVCERAVAPILTDVKLERVDEWTLRVIATGTDPNGDVSAFFVSEDAFDPAAVDYGIESFAEVTGGANFRATGTTYAGAQAVSVHVVVYDRTRAASATRTVAVPGIVKKGGACTTDPSVAICQQGTRCVAAKCVATAPTLSALTVTLDPDTRRSVHIHATGTDPDRDVVTLRLALAGAGDVPYGANPLILSLVDPMTGPAISWEGDAFTVDLDLPWTRTDWIGLSHGTGAALDRWVKPSNAVAFTFDPTLGLGSACNTSRDTCYPGTSCLGGTCKPDAAGACGPDLVVHAIDEVGTPTGPGWVADFALSEVSVVDPSCVLFGGAREAVFSWTPSEDAFAQIATDLPNQKGHDEVAVREGGCFDSSRDLACGDDWAIDGSGEPTVTFDAKAGTTYFIIIENSWQEGGQVLLLPLPYRAAGELCDATGLSDHCRAGLACLGGTCKSVRHLGESCGTATTACTTGLVCSGGSCASDAAAPCGADLAGRVHALTDVGVSAADGSYLVTYDTPAGDSYDDGVCAERNWAEAGPEYVVSWTPAAPVRLTVTTAGVLENTVDTLVYVRRKACRDPSAEVACSDDAEWGLYQSTVTADLVGGETVYVFLDTHAGQTGSVKALFVPVPLYGLGQACALASNDCAPGLACAPGAGGAAICKKVLAADAACGAVDTQCGPGLVCDATAHSCRVDDDKPCGDVAYLDARAADTDGNPNDDVFELSVDGTALEHHATPSGEACAGMGLYGEVAIGVTADDDSVLEVSAHWDSQTADSVFYVRMDACLNPAAERFCQSTKHLTDAGAATPIDAGQTAFVFFDGISDWPKAIRIALIPR